MHIVTEHRWIVRLVLGFALVIAATSGSRATEIRCSILQWKLDRLYFPVGEEAHVYRYAPFTIFYGDDSVYAGVIERSYQGVAISEPTYGFFDTIMVDSLQAVLIPAQIQTAAQFIIGVSGVDAQSVLIRKQESTADSADPRITIREYNDHASMVLDFTSGRLDGCLSFMAPESESSDITTIAQPYPYLAALIPNIARSFNQHGRLTTSLYYRFDPAKLNLYFDGDRAVPVTSFVPSPQYQIEPPGRPFPYDPESGRALFHTLSGKPQQVHLYASNPSLDRLAAYFADILARDRCTVDLVKDRKSADLYLDYVPVHDSLPSSGVYFLHRRLAADSLTATPASEKVRIIDGYFRSLLTVHDREMYFHFLMLVQRAMVDDLGLFALFRPTMFFCAHKHFQGVRFDQGGRLDLSSAYRVVLPAAPREDRQ